MYSPQPVLVGTVLFGSAFTWTTERLSPPLRAVFEQKLAGMVPRSGSLAAPDLVARLAQHIQLPGDVTVPFCGVASRDEKKQSADIFFSCRDPVIGPQCFALAGQIVYRLAHEEMPPDRIVSHSRWNSLRRSGHSSFPATRSRKPFAIIAIVVAMRSISIAAAAKR